MGSLATLAPCLLRSHAPQAKAHKMLPLVNCLVAFCARILRLVCPSFSLVPCFRLSLFCGVGSAALPPKGARCSSGGAPPSAAITASPLFRASRGGGACRVRRLRLLPHGARAMGFSPPRPSITRGATAPRKRWQNKKPYR